jgi:PPM family protein phosphatase
MGDRVKESLIKKRDINIEVSAQSNIGRVRTGNEDNYLVADLSTARTWVATDSNETIKDTILLEQGLSGTILAVSDGMGGALAGEVASQMAVSTVGELMMLLRSENTLSRFDFHEKLRLVIEHANRQIHLESNSNPEYTGMGATFTAAGLIGDTAYLAQVGDSRCYLIRKERIEQVTEDQSLINQLIKLGHVAKEDAESHHLKNVILQALGAQPNVNVSVDMVELRRGDIFLLCSDGLTGKVKDEELLQIVRESGDLKSACERLIDLANERGGEDNITIVLARFNGEGLREPSPDDPLKGEMILRDPNLPKELDLSTLESSDEIPDAVSDSSAEKTLEPPAVIEEPQPVPVTEFSSSSNNTEEPSQPRSWWRRLLGVFSFSQKGQGDHREVVL